MVTYTVSDRYPVCHHLYHTIYHITCIHVYVPCIPYHIAQIHCGICRTMYLTDTVYVTMYATPYTISRVFMCMSPCIPYQVSVRYIVESVGYIEVDILWHCVGGLCQIHCDRNIVTWYTSYALWYTLMRHIVTYRNIVTWHTSYTLWYTSMMHCDIYGIYEYMWWYIVT